MKSEAGHFIAETVELRAAFAASSDTSMTWYPNQGNRVSSIDQLTVVYDDSSRNVKLL